jgi:multiple sugar transport system permease protein
MKSAEGGRRILPGVEVVLGLVMIIVAVPLAWTALLAFMPNRAIVSPTWDFSFWLGNFKDLYGPGTAFAAQTVNSFLLTAGTVVLCLVIGSIAGYSLSRLGPPRWVTLPALALAALLPLVPPMTLVPGLYLTMNALGLLGTVAGLTLLNTLFNLPFAVLLMKSYFDQISGELREAALVDGASEAQTFLRVMVPLVRPGLAAVGIYTAIMAWNEFLLGLTMTSGGTTSPLTVGIASLVQPFEVTWGQMAAAGVLVSIPILILAVIANRQIVSGLTAGAVKG